MLETDALRQVLQTKAVAACQANNFSCQIGNEPFNQPTDGSLYGNFWYRTGKSKVCELGGPTSMESTAGLIQFTIIAPEKSGDGAPTRLGDALAKAFKRKNWQVPPNGYLVTDVMSVTQMPGTRNGVVTFIVDGGFEYFHHDPDATSG